MQMNEALFFDPAITDTARGFIRHTMRRRFTAVYHQGTITKINDDVDHMEAMCARPSVSVEVAAFRLVVRC